MRPNISVMIVHHSDNLIPDSLFAPLEAAARSDGFASTTDFVRFLLIEELQCRGVKGLEASRLALLAAGPMKGWERDDAACKAEEDGLCGADRLEIERLTRLAEQSGPGEVADDAYWARLKQRVDERLARRIEKPAA